MNTQVPGGRCCSAAWLWGPEAHAQLKPSVLLPAFSTPQVCHSSLAPQISITPKMVQFTQKAIYITTEATLGLQTKSKMNFHTMGVSSITTLLTQVRIIWLTTRVPFSRKFYTKILNILVGEASTPTLVPIS